ncbi:unnamed protein product [Aureobasidium mustum]|uniref:2EXR domain-containing protein n=1 Tax=Aureobasidium mustum TaxID=2773714 RepID=A0A9N8PK34_9PEZI|nr:unnamed protein product [Aureobasidium mustum]
MVSQLPSNTIRPKPAPTLRLPQRIPFHRTLIPPTDLYHHPTWAAQREMDAGRPKRSRARVSYVEPTELDDDIADDESLDDSVADGADVASDDPSTDTEDVPSTHSDSDSGSDQEFTTDKLKAQQKKKLAKKINNKKVKKIKDVPFRFMDLPPEIRVMIYKACLVESARDLSFVSKNKATTREFFRGSLRRLNNGWGGYNYRTERESGYEVSRTSLQPVILRINKTIRDEAIPYLYAQPIHFATTHTFQLFFACISSANRLLLRNITIDGWTDTKHASVRDPQIVFSLLMSAINIRHVRLARRAWGPTSFPTYGYHGRSFTKSPQTFWPDLENWGLAMDAAHGKGAAKAALSFTKLCFGTTAEIENESEAVEKREKDFWAQCPFTEKDAEKKTEKEE